VRRVLARGAGRIESLTFGKLQRVEKKLRERVIFAPPWSLKERRGGYTFTDCPEFHAMQTTRPQGISLALPVVRWGARILSVAILLFWGWFLIAHLFSDEGLVARPGVWQDHVGLTALVVSLVGLAIAWKWELAGGVMTLVAVLTGAFINWQVLAFPPAIIPIAGLLFLLCWWMSRAPRKESAARPQ
jgi:hypothetical protein